MKKRDQDRIIRRLLRPKSSTEDIAIQAMFTAYDLGRAFVRGTRKTVRTVRKGGRIIRDVGEAHRKADDGSSLAGFAWRSLDHKKMVKGAMGGAIKTTAKNTGKKFVQSLYREGIEDSSVSALHTAYEGTRTVKDAIHKGRGVYKAGKKLHLNYKVRKNRKKERLRSMDSTARKSRQRAARKMAVKQRKEAMKRARTGIRSAASNALKKLVITLVSNPKVLIAACLIGLVLMIILILPGIIIGAFAPTQTIMADQQTVEKYTARIQEMDANFQARIDGYRNDTKYDDVEIEYMGEEGQLETSWQDILSLMAVKFDQNMSFSQAEQAYLNELYDKMRKIETKTETYRCGGDEKPRRCTRLIVQVYSYSMEDIIDDLGFDQDQKELARSLATTDWASMFPNIPGFAPPENFNPNDIVSAPNTSAARENIKQTALSLVGKVPYFWGGKSSAGMNPKWGTSVLVTAAGSSTTGTYQPYGLDCSGYIDWVYKTAGAGDIFSAGGTAYQWKQSYAINKEDLKVGDLAFLQPPNQSGTNHVGIYVGKDQSGRNLYCHSTYPHGVTVNSFSGFKYFRRPFIKFGDEDGGGS